MGLNSSCQAEWCMKPAQMFCECAKKNFCSNCFSKHMLGTSDKAHKAYSLHSPETLCYKQLKYIKSDHSTEVYEGYLKTTEIIIKIQYFTSKSDLNRKQEEAALQRSTKHENICKCLKSYIDESYTSGYKFVMVIEKALKDLEQEINQRVACLDYWTEEYLMMHLNSLVDALSFMQVNNLIHRDIKPANILIFPDNVLKLADFGLSIQEQDLITTMSLGVVGTYMYLSPKLMKAYEDIQKGLNKNGLVEHNPYKSDVYSLGLTFLYMASLIEPCGLNYNIEGTTYLKYKISRAIEQLNYSQDLKKILSSMLEIEETNRLDFIGLKKILEKPETSLVSFGVSEIPNNEPIYDSMPLSITLAEILSDPLIPIPIKSAISNISNGNSFILSHPILPIELEYVKIAMKGILIHTLDLSDCDLGCRGLKVIIQADLSNITNLSLGNNRLGKRGAKVLGNHLQTLEKLKILRLWSNNFGDIGIQYLFKNKTDNIEEIYLANNYIYKDGAKYISRNLPKSLKILSISDNYIGDKGARLLSVALNQHLNITHLYLDNNHIGLFGVKYLASYLPASLKSLRIIGNNIPEQVSKSLQNLKFKIAV
jgi:serine/threonine protein kinase